MGVSWFWQDNQFFEMQAVLDGKTLITYQALIGKVITMSVSEAMSGAAAKVANVEYAIAA